MPVIFPPIPPIRIRPTADPNPEMDLRARRWAALCHLVGFLVFGVFTALLIIWLVRRITREMEHPFVEDQGQEAVNFQTTMLAGLGLMALAPAPGLVVLLLVVDVVFMVTAAREAHEGRHYRYPYPLTLIRIVQ